MFAQRIYELKLSSTKPNRTDAIWSFQKGINNFTTRRKINFAYKLSPIPFLLVNNTNVVLVYGDKVRKWAILCVYVHKTSSMLTWREDS